MERWSKTQRTLELLKGTKATPYIVLNGSYLTNVARQSTAVLQKHKATACCKLFYRKGKLRTWKQLFQQLPCLPTAAEEWLSLLKLCTVQAACRVIGTNSTQWELLCSYVVWMPVFKFLTLLQAAVKWCIESLNCTQTKCLKLSQTRFKIQACNSTAACSIGSRIL